MSINILSVADIERKHGNISALSKGARKAISDAEKDTKKKFEHRLEQSRSHKGEKIITRREALMHDRANDVYVIVNGVVYDVTIFLEFHPGGPDLILQYAGKDATHAFEGWNPTLCDGALRHGF